MKLRKSQTGFSVIELLLVLIFLALVVIIGYYIYHNQNTTKAVHTNTTASKPSNTSDTTKYLTISEWGIRLPLSGGITDASYKLDTIGGVQSVSLTVPGGCDSMFAIFRGTATDINPTTEAFGGGGGTAFQSSGKKVGNYYYSDETGNASSCFSGEQMASGTANGVKTEAVYSQLKTAFDHMSTTDTN